MKNLKLLFLIFCVLFCYGTPANSKVRKKTSKKVTVKTVKPKGYTVAAAKAEAFKNVKTILPAIYYKSEMTDKYYTVNMSYLAKNICSNSDGTRLLFPSYLGSTLISYGVRYSEKSDRIFYYNSTGNLIRIEIDNNNPETYPKRSLTYNKKGNLHQVVLYLSNTEQYNFDGQGNLVVHWIGVRGFNSHGKPIKIKRSL